jgi:hypothetical protein
MEPEALHARWRRRARWDCDGCFARKVGNISWRLRLSGRCHDTLLIRRYTSEEVPAASFDRRMTPLDLCERHQILMTRRRSNSWRAWKASGMPKSLSVLPTNSGSGSTGEACRGWHTDANGFLRLLPLDQYGHQAGCCLVDAIPN